MTVRELLNNILDAGIDDLDADVIIYHEDFSKWGEPCILQDDFISISTNGDALQIYVHNSPFTEV